MSKNIPLERTSMFYINPKVVSVVLTRDNKSYNIRNIKEVLRLYTPGDTMEIIHRHFKTIVPIVTEDNIYAIHTGIMFNTIKYRLTVNDLNLINIQPVYPMPLFYRGQVIYSNISAKDIICLA